MTEKILPENQRESALAGVFHTQPAGDEAMIIEPYPIADTYADGISHMENLGSCFRIVYFTWVSGPTRAEQIVVANVVRPMTSIITPSEYMRMLHAKPVLGSSADGLPEGQRLNS
jgi:hypothetical protein